MNLHYIIRSDTIEIETSSCYSRGKMGNKRTVLAVTSLPLSQDLLNSALIPTIFLFSPLSSFFLPKQRNNKRWQRGCTNQQAFRRRRSRRGRRRRRGVIVKRKVRDNWVRRWRRWVVPIWRRVIHAPAAGGWCWRRRRGVDVLRGWRRWGVIVSATASGAWRRGRRGRAVGGGGSWRRRRGWRRWGNLAAGGAFDVILGRSLKLLICCHCGWKRSERQKHDETTAPHGSHVLKIRGMRFFFFLLREEGMRERKEESV